MGGKRRRELGMLMSGVHREDSSTSTLLPLFEKKEREKKREPSLLGEKKIKNREHEGWLLLQERGGKRTFTSDP